MLLIQLVIGLTFAYTPPNVGPAPVAPSNLTVKEVYGGIEVGWQDNSSDELGFYVYRQGQLLASTDPNVVKIYDKIDWYDRNKEYCYDVASYAPYVESAHTETKCVYYTATVPAPVTPQPEPEVDLGLTMGFDYPVAADSILSWENSIPDGTWYDYQPFGSLFNYTTKVHLGADLNRGGGDAGHRVFAVSECVVKDFSDNTLLDGWGKWISLKCVAPTGYTYRMPDGQEVNNIYFLYAHLGEIKIFKADGTTISASSIIKGGTLVKKGWQIATVGNANGYYGSAYHLHFECRSADVVNPGAGYMHYDSLDFLNTHVNPIEFINNNRFLRQKVQRVVIHPYELNSAKNAYVVRDANWQRRGRVGTAMRQSFGYGNHVWMADTAKSPYGAWKFKVPYGGNWEVYAYIPNDVATATAAEYKIYHSNQSILNPYKLTLNQGRKPGLNERVYLGKFQFETGSFYSVEIRGYTSDLNKKIVMDALELVLNHADGLGGGMVTEVDSDGDGAPDLWEMEYGLDVSNPTADSIDSDGDGLDDLSEYLLSTDPLNPNSPSLCADCQNEETSNLENDSVSDQVQEDFSDYNPPATDTAVAQSNINNIHIENEPEQNTGCSQGDGVNDLYYVFVSFLIYLKVRRKLSV